MEILITIVIVFFVIAIVESIVIVKKLIQIKKYVDVLTLYENWIEEFALTVESVDKELDRIDEAGVFRSDDEVGFFYQAMYSMLKRLSKYGLTEEPQQVPPEIVNDPEVMQYAIVRERLKRFKRRRNNDIEIEDIQKVDNE